MRELAMANPGFAQSKQKPQEYWFTLPTGETMLCQLRTVSHWSASGEWWQFNRKEGRLQVEKQDGWIFVQGSEG